MTLKLAVSIPSIKLRRKQRVYAIFWQEVQFENTILSKNVSMVSIRYPNWELVQNP